MRYLFLACLLLASCAHYDTILRNGTIDAGSGSAPRVGDVAIRGDRVVHAGNHLSAHAKNEIDVSGMAVAPGFINMLSWATESLIVDGRGMADVKQGVTTEIFGE